MNVNSSTTAPFSSARMSFPTPTTQAMSAAVCELTFGLAVSFGAVLAALLVIIVVALFLRTKRRPAKQAGKKN